MLHELEKHTGPIKPFLDKVFDALKHDNVDVSTYELDHICYRVESIERYLELKNFLSEFGTLISENIINGREISCFKLNDPITYYERNIRVFELPSPKEGSQYKEGFEHVEFVIEMDLESFMKKYNKITFDTKWIGKAINPDVSIDYDGFSVKFHQNSLEYVITYLE